MSKMMIRNVRGDTGRVVVTRRDEHCIVWIANREKEGTGERERRETKKGEKR